MIGQTSRATAKPSAHSDNTVHAARQVPWMLYTRRRFIIILRPVELSYHSALSLNTSSVPETASPVALAPLLCSPYLLPREFSNESLGQVNSRRPGELSRQSSHVVARARAVWKPLQSANLPTFGGTIAAKHCRSMTLRCLQVWNHAYGHPRPYTTTCTVLAMLAAYMPGVKCCSLERGPSRSRNCVARSIKAAEDAIARACRR